MMDHINSYGRPELGDKSPYEMFEFYYGKEILDLLGVHKIVPNETSLSRNYLRTDNKAGLPLLFIFVHRTLLVLF